MSLDDHIEQALRRVHQRMKTQQSPRQLPKHEQGGTCEWCGVWDWDLSSHVCTLPIWSVASQDASEDIFAASPREAAESFVRHLDSIDEPVSIGHEIRLRVRRDHQEWWFLVLSRWIVDYTVWPESRPPDTL